MVSPTSARRSGPRKPRCSHSGTLLQGLKGVVGIFAIESFEVGGGNGLFEGLAAGSGIREDAEGLEGFAGDGVDARVHVVPHDVVRGDVVGTRMAAARRLRSGFWG